MSLAADSEKQHLMEAQAEPCICCPENQSSDRDPSRVDDQERPDWLCQQLDGTSASGSDGKRLARKKLLVAGAISLVFMVGEVIGGRAAHSLAVMTDAAHLLTDFGSILISIFSLWVSSRPRTHTMTFGWHRAEVLGMLLSVVSLWAVTAVLVVSASQRISDGNWEIDSQIMLATSGCAVAVNVLMALVLHQSGASHGHRFPTSRQGRSHAHNTSVKAAFIHVVGDLLQSVGVLLAATIIHFWPEYKVADPVCTFLFSALVLWTTLPVSKDIFRTLMDGAPQDVSCTAVRELLLSVGGVSALHSLHMWSLNATHSLLSAHVVTEEDADQQAVLTRATQLVRSEFGFTSVTIQVEKHRSSQAAS
ncbi:proton-coupled zinc antiporter SLC30A2-like [Aulostomus maculatus]